MIAIDHVILVAADLEAAAQQLLDRHGLASVPGGRHTGHGTANRIIPLGDSYLELMGYVDQEEAAASPLGRWVLKHSRPKAVPTALCLRTDDIAAIATVLGEVPQAMSRVRTDEVRLTWLLAGLDGMLGPESLPFFIQWQVAPEDHPGLTTAPHRVEPRRITEVVIGPVIGPLALMVAQVPGVKITRGQPGVRWVEIATADGPVRIGS